MAGCTFRDWAGNQAADAAAKRAAIHPVLPDLWPSIENAQGVIADIARWLGTVGAYLAKLGSPDCQPEQEQVQCIQCESGQYTPGGLELTDILEVAAECGMWQPRVLHSEVRKAMHGRQGSPEVKRPQGPAVARQEYHATYILRRTGNVVFCRACGANTQRKRSCLLQTACKGPGNGPVARRLRAGRHPTTGAELGPCMRLDGGQAESQPEGS